MIDLKKYKFNEIPKKEVKFAGDVIEIRALTSREMLALSKINDPEAIEQSIFCLMHGCEIDRKTAETFVDVNISDAANIASEIIKLSNDFHGSISNVLEKKI
jgi:hypothetical protein